MTFFPRGLTIMATRTRNTSDFPAKANKINLDYVARSGKATQELQDLDKIQNFPKSWQSEQESKHWVFSIAVKKHSILSKHCFLTLYFQKYDPIFFSFQKFQTTSSMGDFLFSASAFV